MKTDQDIARALLLHRAEGFSIARFVRKSTARHLLSTLAALALLAAVLFADDVPMQLVCMAGFGAYCGAFLRDAAWLRRMQKDWIFTATIIDRQKVEAMANGNESANQPSQPIAGKPGAG